MIKLIKAELLKLKRTLALQMVLIAPALVVLMAFVIGLRADDPVNGNMDPWTRLNGSGLALWSLMMLPLLVTLQSALTGFTEHANSMWKYLFTLPYSRAHFLLAKFTVNALLLALAQIAFIALTLLAGYLLALVKPAMGYSLVIPWRETLLAGIFTYLSSLLIIAIHTWVSLRFRSIVVSLGTGIAAVVASMIIISSKYSRFFPWTIPGLVSLTVTGKTGLENTVEPMSWAITYCLVLAVLTAAFLAAASLEFSRGDAQ